MEDEGTDANISSACLGCYLPDHSLAWYGWLHHRLWRGESEGINSTNISMVDSIQYDSVMIWNHPRRVYVEGHVRDRVRSSLQRHHQTQNKESYIAHLMTTLT
jgi:hypothetical protein